MQPARAAEQTSQQVDEELDGLEPERPNWWRSTTAVILMRLLTIAALLGLWQVLSGPVLPKDAISQPSSVAVALGHYLTSASGWQDIRTTAFEVAVGFLLGVLLGTAGGLVLGVFTTAGRVLEPLVAAVNGIPKIALAPVFLIFFGIGDWSKKAGGPLAILGVIAGEFIASFDGVGHVLFEDSNDLDAAGVFAGLIVLVVMTLILNSLLTALDKFTRRRLGLETRRNAARGRPGATAGQRWSARAAAWPLRLRPVH